MKLSVIIAEFKCRTNTQEILNRYRILPMVYYLVDSKVVKFTQPHCEAMGDAHLLFFSQDPTYKMTYDCWLDIR